MEVGIALLAGVIIGWLIEWVIDWQYWRRGVAGFYATEAQLRSELSSAEQDIRDSAQALEAVQQELQATRAQLQAAKVRESELQRRVNETKEDGDDIRSASLGSDSDRLNTANAIRPDDLMRIEGISAQQMARMHDAGVTTFAQLAQASVEELQEILQPASWQHIDYAEWQEQAAQLAARSATQREGERA